MRLKYNILWVDDNKDIFESLNYHGELIKYVKELFFEPSLIFCETAEEARTQINNKKQFDIIISDYNIGDGDTMEKGDDFISFVRKQNVNTEILFYSAQSKVPKLDVNRISFFSIPKTTEGYPMLLAEIKKLINLTIEKLQDLTIIRGLVMAEVSDLDCLMDNLIEKYFVEQGNVTKKQEFNKHITKDIRDSIKKKLIPNLDSNTVNKCDKKCSHIWEKPEIELKDIVDKLESSKKAQSIDLIIKGIHYDYSGKHNFSTNYLKKIIDMRNDLAHCTSSTEEGREILKTRRGDVIFDNKKFTTIRQNIQEYKHCFKEIESKFNETHL